VGPKLRKPRAGITSSAAAARLPDVGGVDRQFGNGSRRPEIFPASAMAPGKRSPFHFRLRPFLAAFTDAMMRAFFSPHALRSAVTTAPGTG
jgi:hypothetical protein